MSTERGNLSVGCSVDLASLARDPASARGIVRGVSHYSKTAVVEWPHLTGDIRFQAYRFDQLAILASDGSASLVNPERCAGARAATLPLDSAARKEVPLFRGLIRYFPAALAWTARVSKLGNDKHNAGEEMHHARGKSSDHADCIMRHLMDLDADYGKGVGRDENGVPQVGYIVWRALALAQEWLEKNDGAPFAPGARK